MIAPQLPEPEPAHAWVVDLAHEQLVDATHSRLAAAQRAAEAAERATVQIGYAWLARDLGGH
ncbi:hypothetical protein OG880_33285 (plasmid) [Streptomyces cellulosae]|uniref:hypothetical protein n=1 Tax=Streptomyces cellulosae TaxID=1968 RepID=UPI002ED4873A|nr:hypothetical protein OG880_33285 [Streptomyces cellulosae]